MNRPDSENGEVRYPFPVEYDERVDTDSVTVGVEFSRFLSDQDRGSFQQILDDYAREAAERAHGSMSARYVDDLVQWGETERGTYAEVFLDLGVNDIVRIQLDAVRPPLERLYDKLNGAFSSIKKVRVGSGYEDWPQRPEAD